MHRRSLIRGKEMLKRMLQFKSRLALRAWLLCSRKSTRFRNKVTKILIEGAREAATAGSGKGGEAWKVHLPLQIGGPRPASLARLQEALQILLDIRRYRLAIGALCANLHRALRRRARRIMLAWKARAFSTKIARKAFIGKMQLFVRKATLQTCLDKLLEHCRLTRLQKTLTLYMNLVKKSSILNTWLRLARLHRTRRFGVKGLITLLERRYMRLFWRHWRVTIGPRVRLDQRIMMRHALIYWRTSALANKQYRCKLSRRVLLAWYSLVLERKTAKKAVKRGRHVLTVLITWCKRMHDANIRESFALWKAKVGVRIKSVRAPARISFDQKQQQQQYSVMKTPSMSRQQQPPQHQPDTKYQDEEVEEEHEQPSIFDLLAHVPRPPPSPKLSSFQENIKSLQQSKKVVSTSHRSSGKGHALLKASSKGASVVGVSASGGGSAGMSESKKQ